MDKFPFSNGYGLAKISIQIQKTLVLRALKPEIQKKCLQKKYKNYAILDIKIARQNQLLNINILNWTFNII
jgi:hypothetical protein